MSDDRQFWGSEPHPEEDKNERLERTIRLIEKELKVVNERNKQIIHDIAILLHELDCQSARQKDFYSDETKRIIEHYKPLNP